MSIIVIHHIVGAAASVTATRRRAALLARIVSIINDILIALCAHFNPLNLALLETRTFCLALRPFVRHLVCFLRWFLERRRRWVLAGRRERYGMAAGAARWKGRQD